MTTEEGHARPTNSLPPLLDPVVAFRISAVAVAGIAVVGFIMNLLEPGPVSTSLAMQGSLLTFTWAHNIVHVVLAAAALLFGWASLPGPTVRLFALIFGVLYLALGVAGFFTLKYGGAHPDTLMALTPTLNAVHILIGGYYTTAGLMARY